MNTQITKKATALTSATLVVLAALLAVSHPTAASPLGPQSMIGTMGPIGCAPAAIKADGFAKRDPSCS